MKKIFAITLAALLCSVAYSAPTTLIGSLISVNGTSNSTVVVLSPQQVSFQVFNFQNGGLTATNAATLYLQIATDTAGTNFITVGTYAFATTNAGTYSTYFASTNLTINMRIQAVTTNAVSLGGTYGN